MRRNDWPWDYLHLLYFVDRFKWICQNIGTLLYPKLEMEVLYLISPGIERYSMSNFYCCDLPLFPLFSSFNRKARNKSSWDLCKIPPFEPEILPPPIHVGRFLRERKTDFQLPYDIWWLQKHKRVKNLKIKWFTFFVINFGNYIAFYDFPQLLHNSDPSNKYRKIRTSIYRIYLVFSV